LPQTVGYGLRNSRYIGDLMRRWDGASRSYTLLYAVGIIFFCVFLRVDRFQIPAEVADNMRKYGGFIPGIRPGKRTADTSMRS